ncbi:hypothetical protein WA026_020352 [Henosepilachna vigintioctopunctata]|uniref:Uncharacterized protein n=1 Tax=Henosepilachna vigintioctopunctata TaxID=420089 RepID=A0AAW1TXD0_9CUCU
MQTKVNQNQNNRMTHLKEKIVPEHLHGNHALSGNIQPQNNCPKIIVTENNLLAYQENYMNDIINLDNSASHRRKFNTFAAVVEGNQQLACRQTLTHRYLTVTSGQSTSWFKRFLEPKRNFRVTGNNTQKH